MPVFFGILIVILDQLSKYIYVDAGAKTIVVIDGIFDLTYVENRGAAWGMFSDNPILLYIVSGILTLVIIFMYAKFYKKMDRLMRYALILVIAGALGNMIDRVFLSYVRDMFRFAFIDFPVFNVADAAITVGGVLFVLDCLFFEGKKLLSDNKKSDNERNEADVKCSRCDNAADNDVCPPSTDSEE